MQAKIWNFSESAEIHTPYEILDKYASKLMEDTGFIEGRVTEVTSEISNEIVNALYLIVPELSNYSYRLIEVTQPNAFTFYPVTMRLFGDTYEGVIEKNNVGVDEFNDELLKLINHKTTGTILSNLKKHVDVAKKHNL